MTNKVYPAVLAACLLLSFDASAATEEDCKSRWIEADVNRDGRLTAGESDGYFNIMKAAGKADATGGISALGFLEHCLTADALDTGSLQEGANSFTEAQAQDRIVAAGLSNVSELDQDAQGIWRGTAKKDGKTVKVALDFKGTVVAKTEE